MRSFRLVVSTLLLVPVITACGGGGSKDHPDAFVVVADVPIDNPPPPPGCDYGELRDDTNDDFSTMTGSPEDSMVTFNGTSTVLCGKINSTHYDATMKTIDVDSYSVTFAQDVVLYVSLYGTGLENLQGELDVYGGQGFTDFQSYGVMLSGHTSTHMALPAGTYEFAVLTGGAAAATSDVPYKIKIVPDVVDTRCAFLATGGFAEAGDTGTNLGNNMITWDDAAVDPAPAATLTAANDTPEATAITAAAGMNYRLTGNSALNTIVGSYRDSDTFEFTTGPTTTEIAVRFKFPTTTADMDIGIATKAAPADTEPNFIGTSRRLGAGPAEELLTTAVKPSTPYWLWFGGYKEYPVGGATMPSTAATYEATICAKAFVAP